MRAFWKHLFDIVLIWLCAAALIIIVLDLAKHADRCRLEYTEGSDIFFCTLIGFDKGE